MCYIHRKLLSWFFVQSFVNNFPVDQKTISASRSDILPTGSPASSHRTTFFRKTPTSHALPVVKRNDDVTGVLGCHDDRLIGAPGGSKFKQGILHRYLSDSYDSLLAPPTAQGHVTSLNERGVPCDIHGESKDNILDSNPINCVCVCYFLRLSFEIIC